MPTETLNIDGFHQGIVSSPDPKDIDINAASDSTDVEPQADEGKVEGRLQDVAVTSSVIAGASHSATVRNDDGTADVFYLASGRLYVTKNFPSGTTTDLGVITNGGSIAVFNREVRVAGDPPKLVRYNGASFIVEDAEQVAPPSGVTLQDDALRLVVTPIDIDVTRHWQDEDKKWASGEFNALHPGGGSLDFNTVYFYRIAFVYDHTQESVLETQATGTWFFESPNTQNVPRLSGEPRLGPYSLGVDIYLLASLWDSPTRKTGIVLYRAEVPTHRGGAPTTVYTHVATINLTDAGWATAFTTYKKFRVVDDGRMGPSYEDRNGLSETLTSNFVNYKLAVMADSALVAANCTKTGLDDASHMIFKSRANRPDMFNWIEEYMKLPIIPTAMASFGGRLFVFDSNSMRRVNLSGMYVEDALEGVGALGARSVLVTEFGMFIAAPAMAYMHDGRTLQPIGATIATEWKAWAADPIVTVFHQDSNSIVFFKPGNLATAYVYNLAGKRWDKWTFATDASNAGVIVAKDGKVYLPSTPNILKVCADTARKVWTWVSGDLTFGDPSQVKKLYKILATGSGVTITFSVDGGSYNALSGDVAANLRKVKSVRVKLVATAVNQVVSALSLIFRRMQGKR